MFLKWIGHKESLYHLGPFFNYGMLQQLIKIYYFNSKLKVNMKYINTNEKYM